MKFGQQFEFHKIPEWYMNYLDYEKLKKMIEDFKAKRKGGEYMKLPGFYAFTKQKTIVFLDPYNIHEMASDMPSNIDLYRSRLEKLRLSNGTDKHIEMNIEVADSERHNEPHQYNEKLLSNNNSEFNKSGI